LHCPSERIFLHTRTHSLTLTLTCLRSQTTCLHTTQLNLSSHTYSVAHAHLDLPALSKTCLHTTRIAGENKTGSDDSGGCRPQSGEPDHVSAHPYSHSHLLPLRRFLHTEGHLRARNGKTLSCLISIAPGEQHATHAAQPLNSQWRRSSASHILLLTHHSSLRVVD
jgi:hypothetical protein